MPRITVIGGANTDLVGIPSGTFVPSDSNPGHVRVSSGGVARNVAENLARLGCEVELVTSFGSDTEADALVAACEAAGVSTRFSARVPYPGSRYLAVLDDGGDLYAAVNDMRAVEALAPEHLQRAAFEGSDAIVMDTNLPSTTLLAAAALAAEVPIVLDPVSTVKAPRALPVLARLAAIKANLGEAEELSGARGPAQAAARLLDAGVGRVFITMGPGGAWCADRSESFAVAAPVAHVANATGAGDAFCAGVAFGLASGFGMRDTSAWASVLSALTLESETTVSDAISANAVRQRLEAET